MSGELFRFGPFELDPASEELRRSGLIVRIPRQPLRILLLLVRRAGEVVTREEIQAEIWGSGTYVDFEHGINSAVRAIRFALGDQAETPRYVRTLPRRGYSFVAHVEREARGEGKAAAEPPRSRAPEPAHVKVRFAALVVAAVAIVGMIVSLEEARPSGRTISVQPFRRLGPPIANLDERSFAEELRATIGRLPRAHVSVGSEKPDVVIDGTIRQSADGVRVIVSAVDAKTRTQIWSETYQRPPNRKEGMAVEVAHRVMHEVARRHLPPPRREPSLTTKASPGALTLYRRARMLHARTQAYDWMRTKELYEAALREQPKLAEAWSGLGDVWLNQALRGPVADCAHAAAQASHCARRALALQPGNAEALSTLAVLAAQRDYDLATAEELARRAVAADPEYGDARVNLALILSMRGQAADSLREWEIARQLDPVTHDLTLAEPLLYLHARRFEDARARYREILAVNPQSEPARWGLLFAYNALNDWTEAIAHARTFGQCPKVDVPVTQLGFLRLLHGFEEAMQEARRRDRVNDYFLALYFAQIGQRDRAFALLHNAVDLRVPIVSYIMVDPRLDPLRGDPRFNALLARLNLARPPQRSQIAMKPALPDGR